MEPSVMQAVCMAPSADDGEAEAEASGSGEGNAASITEEAGAMAEAGLGSLPEKDEDVQLAEGLADGASSAERAASNGREGAAASNGRGSSIARASSPMGRGARKRERRGRGTRPAQDVVLDASAAPGGRRVPLSP